MHRNDSAIGNIIATDLIAVIKFAALLVSDYLPLGLG